MNILFDKTQPRLVMNGFPLEATNYKLKVNEYLSEGAVNGGSVEIGNYGLLLQATLQAIKVEEVQDLTPQLDAQGQPVLDVDGTPLVTGTIKFVETILETKVVDLKVL